MIEPVTDTDRDGASPQGPSEPETRAEAASEAAGQPTAPAPQKGRIKRMVMPIAMRHALLQRGIGIQVVYRSNSGGLVVGGLSYAALFALIPTLILVIAGIFFLVDDPEVRREAVSVIDRTLPALSSFTDTAVAGAQDLATVGGIIALIGFMWGASGLYLNLTRAMERFFPGERVSGALARVVGVLLVLAMIVAVLIAVFMAGVVTVIARALQLDAEWILTTVSVLATLVLAAAIVYAIYRVIPANPPAAASARLPAALVGTAIAGVTLLYSVISPWLVSGYQVFGVAASVFVALIWLRVVFLAMVYGAAMARYRDYVHGARLLGEAEPERYATEHALAEEAARAERELASAREIERRQAEAEAVDAHADDSAPTAPGEKDGSADER